MKHVKLFEQFNSNSAQEILEMLMSDQDYTGYRLSLKNGGDVNFIVWENPEEDQRWLDSGYAEYYEAGDDVSMPILAINDEGTIFKLAPEEKYSHTYSEYGNCGSAYDETGKINYTKVKAEFEDSIWNYEG